MYLGLCSYNCYDEYVNDTLEPIIAQIKEGRSQGLDDTELEQQLLLGDWTEQEIQAGQNFLHFTQRSPALKAPMAQDVIHKEEVFRRRTVQKNIFLYWMLPIGVIGGLSIVVGLLMNNFLYSHVTGASAPHTTISSVFPIINTEASSTFSTSTTPSIPPVNQIDTTNHSQIRVRGMVVCTQDKKICANGKMVGRTPPTCEFTACPQ